MRLRPRMRSLAVIVAAVAAGGVAAPTGFAATLARADLPITVAVHPTVTPDRAGTLAHPQGIRLGVHVAFGIPISYDPPLVRAIEVWFPRGGLYEGASDPVCTERALAAIGPEGCPRDSIVGGGVGHATADRTGTDPRITIVNGGATRVWFYVVLNNPARVQEPLAGVVTPLHGRWSYRLRVAIPANLQIVAGIPLVLHTLDLHAGDGDWLATTSCPGDHRWPWQATGFFTDGQQITSHGAVHCRPAP